MADSADRPDDALTLALDLGLAGVLILAPLPFGAVGAPGRLALEIGALILGALWIVRSLSRQTPLPPRPVLVGMIGLVLLALLQATPLGSSWLSRLSPAALDVRVSARPPATALAAEEHLLGVDPAALEPRPAPSVDPRATASALRTGVALALLLLVATTVAATRGVRAIAMGLLISAGFQGLYGLLVVASGHDRLWHLPKKYYLDSATGTYVNRNHFATFMAASLACAAALVLQEIRRRRLDRRRGSLAALLGGTGSRTVVLGLLLLIGLAGLLASSSRAGIALGLTSVVFTLVAAGRSSRVHIRLAAAGLLISAALVPLAQLGSERLLVRYTRSAEILTLSSGRGRVWQDTLQIAADFPLLGSGFGTFATVYPLYRSPQIRKYYSNAHNDLVQSVAEGGLVGTLLLLLIALPLLRAIAGGLVGAKGTLGVGFAAGLSALLLHTMIDFDFHIPASAATAAVLAGALLGLPWNHRD